MNVEKPNLFSFATSELSQDAFICWLASWAKPELKAIDPLLHKTAQEFIVSLVLKCKKEDEVPDIETIDIQRQDDRIDVIIFVNKLLTNRLAILIEDKTHTNHHSGQLDRYYSLIKGDKYAFDEEQIIPIFLKTGYQSYFDIGIYKLYSRLDFLSVLRKGNVNGIKNAIYDDFLKPFGRDGKRYKSVPEQATKRKLDCYRLDWFLLEFVSAIKRLSRSQLELYSKSCRRILWILVGICGFWPTVLSLSPVGTG